MPISDFVYGVKEPGAHITTAKGRQPPGVDAVDIVVVHDVEKILGVPKIADDSAQVS